MRTLATSLCSEVVKVDMCCKDYKDYKGVIYKYINHLLVYVTRFLFFKRFLAN